MRIALPLLPLLLGCNGAVEDAKDRDGDGYQAFQVGGDDCDDSDPAINPGVTEVCGDSVDNNCDAVIDDSGAGAQTFYRDADRDDYGGSEAIQACTQPANHAATSDDCDDGNASIHPGADETWYDGIDQDCDEGDDYDQDGDGYSASAHLEGGTDCEDTLADVHPGKTELCGNHLDDDCDGTDNTCLWEAWGAWTAFEHASIALGTAAPQVQVGNMRQTEATEIVAWEAGAQPLYIFGAPIAPGATLTAANTYTELTLDEGIMGFGAVLGPTQIPPYETLVVWTFQSDGSLEFNRFDEYINLTEGAMSTVDRTGTLTGTTSVVGQPPAEPGFALIGTMSGHPGDGLAFHDFDSLNDPQCAVSNYLYPQSGGLYIRAGLRLTNCQRVANNHLTDDTGKTWVLAQTDAGWVRVDPEETGTVHLTTLTPLKLWADEDDRELMAILPDFDGDSYEEVFVVGPPPNPNDTSERHQAEMAFGPFGTDSAPTTTLDLSGHSPGNSSHYRLLDLEVADINGDGFPDLVRLWADYGWLSASDEWRWVEVTFGPVDHDAPFAKFLDYTSVKVADLTESIDVGDVDGDGYDDVVFAYPGNIGILYGQGR